MVLDDDDHEWVIISKFSILRPHKLGEYGKDKIWNEVWDKLSWTKCMIPLTCTTPMILLLSFNMSQSCTELHRSAPSMLYFQVPQRKFTDTDLGLGTWSWWFLYLAWPNRTTFKSPTYGSLSIIIWSMNVQSVPHYLVLVCVSVQWQIWDKFLRIFA